MPTEIEILDRLLNQIFQKPIEQLWKDVDVYGGCIRVSEMIEYFRAEYGIECTERDFLAVVASSSGGRKYIMWYDVEAQTFAIMLPHHNPERWWNRVRRLLKTMFPHATPPAGWKYSSEPRWVHDYIAISENDLLALKLYFQPSCLNLDFVTHHCAD